jgi:hypothetical protein
MMNMDQKPEDFTGEFCPHLALKDDASTVSAYPSQWNACYHVNPPEVPNLPQQHEFCLTTKYVDCVIYKNSPDQKMPKPFRYRQEGLSKELRKILKIGSLLLVIVLLVLLFIFRGPLQEWFQKNVGGGIVPTTEPTDMMIFQSPTVQIFSNPTRTEVATEIEPTLTPSLIPTPIPTTTDPPLALETPIGSTYQFVIHRVQEGESMMLFTNWYGTSSEAIQVLNPNLTYPIKIGDLLIIPIGIVDVRDLPAFEAYEVQGEVLVEDLANELGVVAEDLMLYNNIEPGFMLRSGDWIVVPRERVEP